MEYSLSNLNKNAELCNIDIDTIINKLNLIGFEVDDINFTKITSNFFYEDAKLLLKIPANREDLLTENYLLIEFSTIFLFKLYNFWEKYKFNYSHQLKKHYLKYYQYETIQINSDLKDILIYNIEFSFLEQTFSPIWIKNKLLESGLESYNNFSDVIRLINLEWGQGFNIFSCNDTNESHSFTLTQAKNYLDKLSDFTNLETNSIILSQNRKILSILGIENNENSENDINRKKILSAIYYDIHNDPLFLNQFATKISYRHLRKLCLTNFRVAFQRLLTLFEILFSISICKKIYVNKLEKVLLFNNKILALRIRSLKNYLNLINYDPLIFQKAGLQIVCQTNSCIYFNIPNQRKDLQREIDLIEEYSRFVGYKNFSEIMPIKSSNFTQKKSYEAKAFIKQFFLSHNFHEILNTSLYGASNNKLLNNKVVINNPLNKELSSLRNELLSNLLLTFKYNCRSDFKPINIFEIGRVFTKTENNIFEQDKLAGIFQLNLYKKTNVANLEWFIAKGFIENFMSFFNYSELSFHSYQIKNTNFHPKKSIIIEKNGKKIGEFGEVNPTFYKSINNKFAIYMFEFDLAYFQNWRLKSNYIAFKDYSKYPKIVKDLSCLSPKTINFFNLKKEIQKSCKFLKQIEFFDIYFDEKNSEKIKLGIRFVFQSTKQTLTTEIAETNIENIKKLLTKKFLISFET